MKELKQIDKIVDILKQKGKLKVEKSNNKNRSWFVCRDEITDRQSKTKQQIDGIHFSNQDMFDFIKEFYPRDVRRILTKKK
mgnify:CR=1 FL=1|tara:strand:- start:89 stop:331 length:243 start_codon:yes stop_codon:yes gene_type:complete